MDVVAQKDGIKRFQFRAADMNRINQFTSRASCDPRVIYAGDVVVVEGVCGQNLSHVGPRKTAGANPCRFYIAIRFDALVGSCVLQFAVCYSPKFGLFTRTACVGV